MLGLFWSIDGNSRCFSLRHADSHPILKEPELLKTLGDFERRHGPRGELLQDFPSVSINPDVLFESLGAGASWVRNGVPAEVKSVARQVGDDFDDGGIRFL